MNKLDGSFAIDGPGGEIRIMPFKAKHGSIDSLGFRIKNVAYLPDVSDLYQETRKSLENLDYFIVDALRRTPHPSHTHLENTLKWIDELKPSNSIITNMHIDMDYDTLHAELPNSIVPAYDGMKIEIEL
jgi:phosphoribosyl 1,2-cyclic phosphate phosphodiesterase